MAKFGATAIEKVGASKIKNVAEDAVESAVESSAEGAGASASGKARNFLSSAMSSLAMPSSSSSTSSDSGSSGEITPVSSESSSARDRALMVSEIADQIAVIICNVLVNGEQLPGMESSGQLPLQTMIVQLLINQINGIFQDQNSKNRMADIFLAKIDSISSSIKGSGALLIALLDGRSRQYSEVKSLLTRVLESAAEKSESITNDTEFISFFIKNAISTLQKKPKEIVSPETLVVRSRESREFRQRMHGSPGATINESKMFGGNGQPTIVQGLSEGPSTIVLPEPIVQSQSEKPTIVPTHESLQYITSPPVEHRQLEPHLEQGESESPRHLPEQVGPEHGPEPEQEQEPQEQPQQQGVENVIPVDEKTKQILVSYAQKLVEQLSSQMDTMNGMLSNRMLSAVSNHIEKSSQIAKTIAHLIGNSLSQTVLEKLRQDTNQGPFNILLCDMLYNEEDSLSDAIQTAFTKEFERLKKQNAKLNPTNKLPPVPSTIVQNPSFVDNVIKELLQTLNDQIVEKISGGQSGGKKKSTIRKFSAKTMRRTRRKKGKVVRTHRKSVRRHRKTKGSR